MTWSSRNSQISSGVGTPPSFLPTRPPLVSSRMISLHNSTHSSQMKTVGPAISLRTSCCDFPQKLQYRVLFESEPVNFVILPSLFPAHGHIFSGQVRKSVV